MTQMFWFESPAPPPSPGDVLGETLLDGMDLTQAELAAVLGISRPRLNMILKGRCPITAEIALRIERVFDIPPHYWFRIRTEYELFEERQKLSQALNELTPLRASADRETTAWVDQRLQEAA